MKYSNPKIPEEINYSKENPLKEFFILAVGIFALVIGFAFIAHLSAQHFAQYIPFKYEKNISPKLLLKHYFTLSEDTKKQEYITTLSENLSQHMNIPDDITLQVHYSDSKEVNAFASLNGIIIITQGLIDFVESENELAFVIAHEIGHIKERHPIKSLSSELIIGLTMSLITDNADSNGAASALTTSTTFTSLSFSRSNESDADSLALHALHAYYGHIQGSHDFFTRLKKEKHIPAILQFTSTHPGHEQRIKHINNLEKQWISDVNLVLTPLPDLFKQ